MKKLKRVPKKLGLVQLKHIPGKCVFRFAKKIKMVMRWRGFLNIYKLDEGVQCEFACGEAAHY
jgi:hypothetical protein